MKACVAGGLLLVSLGCKASPEDSKADEQTENGESGSNTSGEVREPNTSSTILLTSNEGTTSAFVTEPSERTVAGEPATGVSHPTSTSEGAGSSSDGATLHLPRFQIAAGESGTCAIDSEQRVRCWGDLLEDGREWETPEGTYFAVFARSGSMCALDADGIPVCFGYPDADTTSRFTSPIARLATGTVSCAVGVDGVGYCLEPAPDAVFGDPEAPYYLVPSGETVTEVDSGVAFACGLRIEDGTAVCWGPLIHREITTSECTNSPLSGQADPARGRYEQLDVGNYTVCALAEDGELDCWGVGGPEDDPDVLNCEQRFNFGQAIPPDGAGFRQVSVGVHHACAIESSGSVTCWGAGAGEGCEDGDCEQSRAPAGTYDQVSAGVYHTCAMRADRTVECWGAPGSPSMRAIPESLRATQ